MNVLMILMTLLRRRDAVFMYLGSPVFPLAGISEYVPCMEESLVYRVMVLPHELGLVPG